MRLFCFCSVVLFFGSVSVALGQINCPPNLPLTLNGNLEYCVGTPGSELSIAQTYDEYLWLPGQESTQFVLLTAGNYQVIVTHYTGCQDTLEFEVNQVSNPPQPTITANGPTEFCEGESVVLTGTTGYPYYTWNSGSVTNSLTVYETGIYVMSIADWLGCVSSSNSIYVEVNPLPTALFSPNLDGFGIEFNNNSVDATDYEWNFGDGNGSFDFEPTHLYTTEGPHTVWLAASNTCGTDTAFYTDLNVGIATPSFSDGWKLYPTPATSFSSVEFSLNNPCETTISVHDPLGKLLLSTNIQAVAGKNIVQLDLTDIPTGIYLVTLSSKTEFRSARLVVAK